MLKFEIEDLFRGDLDDKILDYIKTNGRPDSISYGTRKNYYTASLYYYPKVIVNFSYKIDKKKYTGEITIRKNGDINIIEEITKRFDSLCIKQESIITYNIKEVA